jgi:DnaJ like chaperone protein
MRYQRREQPGCGGCLFVALLIVLATGGGPLLFDLLGFFLFGVFFLVVLGIAGAIGMSWWMRKAVADYEASQSEAHNRFVFLLVHILVNIAAMDGEISRAETDTIYGFFRTRLGYGHSQMLWVRELVREAVAAPLPLDDLLREFSGFSYEVRLVLLDLVYQVIYTKSPPPAAELDAAARIAAALGIAAYDHQAVRGRYAYSGYYRAAQGAGAGDERYYRVLGLEPGASPEEIKKAYRNLSRKYHPDMVASLGEEFRRDAEEKMKEINEAYDRLIRKP